MSGENYGDRDFNVRIMLLQSQSHFKRLKPLTFSSASQFQSNCINKMQNSMGMGNASNFHKEFTRSNSPPQIHQVTPTAPILMSKSGPIIPVATKVPNNITSTQQSIRQSMQWKKAPKMSRYEHIKNQMREKRKKSRSSLEKYEQEVHVKFDLANTQYAEYFQQNIKKTNIKKKITIYDREMQKQAKDQ